MTGRGIDLSLHNEPSHETHVRPKLLEPPGTQPERIVNLNFIFRVERSQAYIYIVIIHFIYTCILTRVYAHAYGEVTVLYSL